MRIFEWLFGWRHIGFINLGDFCSMKFLESRELEDMSLLTIDYGP